MLNRRAGGARALPIVAAAALLLAGCGSGDDDPGPGGVTVGEARALDEAAEMLDQQRLHLQAVRDAAASERPAPSAAPEVREAGARLAD